MRRKIEQISLQEIKHIVSEMKLVAEDIKGAMVDESV